MHSLNGKESPNNSKMGDNYFKILAPNIVGLSLSMAEVEQGLRLLSLTLGITLSIVAFVNNQKHKKKDKE